MSQVISLGLGDPPQAKKKLEKELHNAIRAERLLDYPEMKWWLEQELQEEEQKQWNRLLKPDNEKRADEARGAINVLRDITKRLQFMAKQRPKLEECLNE